MIPPDANTDRVFDNADSFAMVFVATWKKLVPQATSSASQAERIETALAAMKDHPFVISSPEIARQVAEFRIRLLELS